MKPCYIITFPSCSNDGQRYPLDNAMGSPSTYPLDSDLSNGQRGLMEGGVRVCSDTVLLDFWCSFADIFNLSCGIVVLQNQAACGIQKFWGEFNAVYIPISVGFCGIRTPLRPLLMDTWKMNQMEIQWNPALQPPPLYDHLIITTTVFRANGKKHWSFYYYEDPVNTTTSLL